ncbi:hypothetical protein [Halanaerobium hydrogeniformans]|uniref:Uncharacterized protein n=1 Tax=Halanaerobium hydrogeniformans TaxID=656519 RepID=E4RPI4_HALHG|nr:hypothetical protein [Halanaerobium hydrogeniformans]ADQ14007.1 hypothetical protein Halsa_0539 [Halanaerobium hydrogeniformans]
MGKVIAVIIILFVLMVILTLSSYISAADFDSAARINLREITEDDFIVIYQINPLEKDKY